MLLEKIIIKIIAIKLAKKWFLRAASNDAWVCLKSSIKHDFTEQKI